MKWIISLPAIPINFSLFQVNQIGTVTESIKAHNMAKEQGWGTMVSHRYLLYISKYSTSMSGPARPRIASSPTWLSALEPARSRLELLAGILY